MGQVTSNLIMIRPSNFGYNAETAQNNSFQSVPDTDNSENIQKTAILEFDNAVKGLREQGVNVLVVQDSAEPVKPDAIFPNNWFSTHNEGVLITYPMWAKNRRIERNEEVLGVIENKFGVDRRYNFEYLEDNEQFLEGTGSMILDRVNKIVYACLSPRTEILALEKFCVLMGYRKCVFTAVDAEGDEVYHTNVIMAVADQFVVVCLECIKDEDERKNVVKTIESSGKELFEISFEQVNLFAGNMLQVKNNEEELFLVMSQNAHDSLTIEQINTLKTWNDLIVLPIPTIERYGGGSIRCMMAENFLEVN